MNIFMSMDNHKLRWILISIGRILSMERRNRAGHMTVSDTNSPAQPDDCKYVSGEQVHEAFGYM